MLKFDNTDAGGLKIVLENEWVENVFLRVYYEWSHFTGMYIMYNLIIKIIKIIK